MVTTSSLVAAALWAVGVAEPPVKIAVPDIAAVGIDAGVGKLLTELMVTDVSRIAGLSVVTTSDIVALLGHEKDRQLLGCADNLSCMAEIGGALGVDYLLVGTVGQLGDTHVLTLKLIEVKSAVVKQRGSRTIRGEADALIDAMRALLAEATAVLAPAATAAPPQAETTPPEPTPSAVATGAPAPAAPRSGPSWVQWTLIGVGAAALVAGGGVERWAHREQDRGWSSLTFDAGDGTTVDIFPLSGLDHFDNARRGGRIALGLFVGGGLTLGGGLLWWWLGRAPATVAIQPLLGAEPGLCVTGSF